MNTTTKQSEFKTEIKDINAELDNLMEERSAFLAAGMTKKVAEWDYKIKSLEISAKYPRITFADIAKEFNIAGLQKAVDGVVNKQWEKKRKLQEAAKEMCHEVINAKKMSEAQLYRFIDQNKWRYESNPELTSEIVELLLPKLTGTVKILFESVFMAKRQAAKVEIGKTAFIKIERVADYEQNDNPPMRELMKLVQAKHSGIFKDLYIAYPMIDNLKQIDPIFFGVDKIEGKQYDSLNGFKDRHTSGIGFMSNDEVTMDRLNSINIGDMYKIAQWE